MKSLKKIITLSAICLLGGGLLLTACDGTTSSSNGGTSSPTSSETSETSPSNPSNPSTPSTPSSDIPSNVLETLEGLVPGATFTAVTGFETSATTLLARYDASVDGTVTHVIYRGVSTSIGFVEELEMYFSVDVNTFTISNYVKTSEEYSSHGHDSQFADDALGLIGTDGNVTNNVSGATLSSTAIKTIAQESVAQAKLDFNYVPEEIELHVPSVDEDGDPLKTIAKDAYANREDIVKVYIPSTVTTIDQRAFQGCVNLKEIVYEDSKTTTAIRINANAFEGCTSLDTVSLYINNIGTSAFKDCTSLESFEIDSKSVGNYAFENCTSLTHVIFTDNGGSSSRGKDMFRGCTSLKNIYVDSTNTHLEVVDYEGYSVLYGFSSYDADSGKYSSGKILSVFDVTAQEPVEFVIDNHCTYSTGICDDYTLENIKISKFTVDPNATNITWTADENGLLYKDNTLQRLYYVPNAFEGDLTIKSSVTYLNSGIFAPEGIEDVIVEEGNKFFAVDEGVLYYSSTYDDSQTGTTVTEIDYGDVLYVNKSKTGVFVLNAETDRIEEYALQNCTLDGIVIPNEAGTKFKVDETSFIGVKATFKIYFTSETYINDYKGYCESSKNGWTKDMLQYISDTIYTE